MTKKKKWYERQEILKINQDWVSMHCKNITKREMKILEILSERKLIRRDHLEIINDDYRKLGNNRTLILNRSLKKLFEKSCVDKVHEEPEFQKGNLPAVFALDRAGAILLKQDKKFKRRIKQIYKFGNGEKYPFRELPNNYPHIHGVNELEVQTILLGEEMGFEKWKWELEEKNAKIFMYNKRYVLIPDVFMILKIGKVPFIAYIEYDTGTEDLRYKDKYPTIREKLEKYMFYKLTKSWKEEGWAKHSEFPILFFIVEDKKRIKYINQKGKALGLNVKAMHSSDYKKNLKAFVEDLQR